MGEYWCERCQQMHPDWQSNVCPVLRDERIAKNHCPECDCSLEGYVTLSPAGEQEPDWKALVLKRLGPHWFLSPAIEIKVAGSTLSMQQRNQLRQGCPLRA
jgi:hypothetical protein